MEQQTSPTKYADISIHLLDEILSQSYLSTLSGCEVQTPPTKAGTSVRWYKINKIVVEKDVFFGDKLSMLYMALHEKAKNVILVLNKEDSGNIELYLGARDFVGEENHSGDILKSGLGGYLPGVSITSDKKRTYAEKLSSIDFETPHIASLSAMASLRDDKKETFVQGLERLINATTMIPSFRAYFIAENVSEKQAQSMINAFSQIYTSLTPLAECQITISESQTEGISESISEGISKSISANISKTLTHSEGTSSDTTKSAQLSIGHTTNYSPNMIDSIGSMIFGGESSSSNNLSASFGKSKRDGKSVQDAEADQTGVGISKQKNVQYQKSTNLSDTTGKAIQLTYKNKALQYHLELIDKQIERLSNGIPFGLWSVATYFVAPLETTALKLANIYRGCIIGEESNLGACAINVWSDQNEVFTLLESINNASHPRFKFDGIEDVSAGVTVTSKELAIHLSLPQSSVPGVLVREEQSFGTNVISTQPINLDSSICIGNILHLGQENPEAHINIDLDSMTKHTFITGTTGSGKSNTIYLLLKELQNKKKQFLVIEPTKGEYKQIFGNSDSVSVYGSNPNTDQLLRINPFSFPDWIHVYEHIDRLVDIFNACWPMYAAMPVVLKKAITDAYANCGWDLYSSSQNINSEQRIYPTVNDVVMSLREFINKSEYSADTKGDYKGSLETRLVSMSEGLTGMMLNNTVGNISDYDLFRKNVIVDLSHVGNSETRSLIMGLIIMKMYEYYQTNGSMNSPLKHITVLEEAHHILKRTIKEQFQESSNLAGKSVEMLCNSIAEMRTYGEGFIIADQSPSQLDLSAIRNTNTKIIMNLPEAEDRDTAGKSIGLNDDQINEIGRQKVGEAIIYQNDWEEPVQCRITLFKHDNSTYYNKKDELNSSDKKAYLIDIIKFLSSYGERLVFQEKELAAIEKQIVNSDLLSTTKYSLLKLIEKYRNNGVDMSKDNHVHIMELASNCIGMTDRIGSIISSKKNVTDVNDSLRNALEIKFPEQDDYFYRFCVRSILRVRASKSSKAVDFYNNWLKQYYK